LCNVKIVDAEIEQLQINLVKSHACGLGEPVPQEVVKLMLLLKIQSLSYGNSGVQLKTVQLLCELINHKIYPLVYQQGSLGASGDLAPLAHLSLPLLGLGKVIHNNKLFDTDWVLQRKQEEDLQNLPNSMSAEKFAAVLAYRQALRDITKTYSDIKTVVWPTDPLS
jgi:histidine ammonia-lyase